MQAKVNRSGEQLCYFMSNNSMNTNTGNQSMKVAVIALVFSFFSFPSFAVASTFNALKAPGYGMIISDLVISEHRELLLAEAEDKRPVPEPGSLVIPGETDARDKANKQCLNVCKKWGEDCIINPRTGARNCRRTCKEFGEECF